MRDRHALTPDNVVVGLPWAYDKGFRIDQVKPSQVVLNAVERKLIHFGNNILDLGCGKNPRNAIALAANLQCFVDGVDLEPAELPDGMPDEVLQRMRFHQISVLDFEYKPETYHVAILARLLQYLPSEDLAVLMRKVYQSLLPNGAALVSYTAKGGVLSKGSEYNIQTFAHPINEVEELLNNSGFSIISLEPGASQSTHVPHAGEPAETYDIIAQK